MFKSKMLYTANRGPDPVRGKRLSVKVGSCPKGTTLAGTWHTHGAYDPALDLTRIGGTINGNENFSLDDIEADRLDMVPSWLGTPGRRIYRFDPRLVPGSATYSDIMLDRIGIFTYKELTP